MMPFKFISLILSNLTPKEAGHFLLPIQHFKQPSTYANPTFQITSHIKEIMLADSVLNPVLITDQ